MSIKIDTYQQQRRTRSDRSRKTVEGGVGPVAGVSDLAPPSADAKKRYFDRTWRSLMSRITRRSYTDEFKHQAVELA
ncbi:hypothetical protein, partial [Stenotrophomonas maltophilia]|uniref:hypothetical protein n=1 Tax=Stenotrophomonas maltophilia TaxID=40324 RepID=UPI001A7E4386